jgi:hypothetical protein
MKAVVFKPLKEATNKDSITSLPTAIQNQTFSYDSLTNVNLNVREPVVYSILNFGTLSSGTQIVGTVSQDCILMHWNLSFSLGGTLTSPQESARLDIDRGAHTIFTTRIMLVNAQVADNTNGNCPITLRKGDVISIVRVFTGSLGLVEIFAAVVTQPYL